jgi:hypothetical protein
MQAFPGADKVFGEGGNDSVSGGKEESATNAADLVNGGAGFDEIPHVDADYNRGFDDNLAVPVDGQANDGSSTRRRRRSRPRPGPPQGRVKHLARPERIADTGSMTEALIVCWRSSHWSGAVGAWTNGSPSRLRGFAAASRCERWANPRARTCDGS